jgi:phosphate transport system substrate-binding protein
MKNYVRSLLAVILSFTLLTSCTSGKNSVNIAGSTTVLPIVQAAAETYMNEHPDVNITVRGGGTGIGIKSIINRVIDIGNASRKINVNEEEMLKNNENLTETAIALDALCLIVNSTNPVDSITTEQLEAIYTGSLTNWRQLGGRDADIVIISRDISSGSYEIFNHKVLNSGKIINHAMMLASNNAVATTVANTPGAIGYVGLGFTSSEKVKTLKLDGIYPSATSVQNESYPLTRPLFMYTQKSADSDTEDFIDFLLSAAGQKIVVEQGYIRIN